jgi:hypothetical protein
VCVVFTLVASAAPAPARGRAAVAHAKPAVAHARVDCRIDASENTTVKIAFSLINFKLVPAAATAGRSRFRSRLCVRACILCPFRARLRVVRPYTSRPPAALYYRVYGMHGSIACVAVALSPLQPGLQEPTRWAWGPWVIQKAAGIDGPDSDMPAPGAVFVRVPLSAAQTHAHTRACQHARPFDAAERCARVPARMPERVHMSACVCVRVRGCGCQCVGVCMRV